MAMPGCGVAMFRVRRGYVRVRRGYVRVRRGYVRVRRGYVRVRRGYVHRVRRGYVVSAPGCCTAVPGSNPARHPSLGSAQENPGAEKYRSRFFPALQQENQRSSRRISPSPRMNIVSIL